MKERLNEYISLVEENLKKYTSLTPKTAKVSRLVDAMNYSLEAGGKRIRPALVFEFCRVCGGDINDVIAPACGIEMIHTYSLIHDDLPAMDNDDMRRGKPSCHKAFDEATAILAGDTLTVLPFEIIADDENLSDRQKISIISCLAKAVGAEGMIGGQVIDMENEKRDSVTAENLMDMYKRKTGALIMASCVMGCIGANADEKKIKTATEYAYRLGLAFQIIDDILDVEGDSEVIGKPVGSDADENKTTFVTIYGVRKAKEIAKKITEEALGLLEGFDDNTFLKELTAMLLNRDR